MKKIASKNNHNKRGKYLKDSVYGSLDGIVTTFAIVSGVVGANLSSKIILILGFANLFADGISMSAGNYLGTKSEKEFYRKEKEVSKVKKYLKNPLKAGGITFLAFVIAGLTPLIPYILTLFIPSLAPIAFKLSIIFSAAILFIAGSARTTFTGRTWYVSGFEMLLIGGAAAAVAYYIGYFVSSIV